MIGGPNLLEIHAPILPPATPLWLVIATTSSPRRLASHQIPNGVCTPSLRTAWT
jgi:hypothetical protein